MLRRTTEEASGSRHDDIFFLSRLSKCLKRMANKGHWGVPLKLETMRSA